MAYEVYQRTLVRTDEPKVAFTPEGRIILNAAAARLMGEAGVKFVLLLWDKSNRKIAFKATPKGDANAYSISYMGTRGGSLRARMFLRHVGWDAPKRTNFFATWSEKDKMLEIILPRR